MSSNLWISVLACGPLLGAWAGGQNPAPSASTNPPPAREMMRRVTVDISKLSGMSTLIGFHYTNRPPWPDGNYLTFVSKSNVPSGLPPGGWQVENMHTENYNELVKRRRLKSLELGLLADHRCLVIDPRVPREWLLAAPRGGRALERRLSLKTQFAEFFRKDPQAEALVGTSWLSVRRRDPDGLLQRVLPGEKMDFGAVELTCRTASGEICGRRSWEFDGARAPASISVYDVQSTTTYTGAALKFTRHQDEMTLVPQSTLKREADGLRYDTCTVFAEAVYRISPRTRAEQRRTKDTNAGEARGDSSARSAIFVVHPSQAVFELRQVRHVRPPGRGWRGRCRSSRSWVCFPDRCYTDAAPHGAWQPP